jgi:hypothetical protein
MSPLLLTSSLRLRFPLAWRLWESRVALRSWIALKVRVAPSRHNDRTGDHPGSVRHLCRGYDANGYRGKHQRTTRDRHVVLSYARARLRDCLFSTRLEVCGVEEPDYLRVEATALGQSGQRNRGACLRSAMAAVHQTLK